MFSITVIKYSNWFSVIICLWFFFVSTQHKFLKFQNASLHWKLFSFQFQNQIYAVAINWFIYIFWYFIIILLFENSIVKPYVLFPPHYFLLYLMKTKLVFFPSWFFWVDIFFLVYSVALSTISVSGLHHLPLHSVKPGNEVPNLFSSRINIERMLMF